MSDELWNVPFKFEDGETLDPKRLNANLLHLRKILRQVSAQRYSYFSLVYPLGELTQGDDAELGTFYVQCPFAYEIIGSTLVLEDDDGDTYTVTSSDSDFRSYTVTPGGTGAYASGGANQNIQVSSAAEVSFSVSIPTTASNVAHGTLTVRCRYDALSGLQDLPTVPQFKSETPSASEIDTFLSAVDEYINDTGGVDGLDELYPVRKRAQVISFFEPATSEAIWSPNMVLSNCTYGLYNIKADTNNVTLTAYDQNNAQNVFAHTDAGSNSTGTTFSSPAETATNDPSSGPGLSPITYTVTTTGGTLHRLYAVIYGDT